MAKVLKVQHPGKVYFLGEGEGGVIVMLLVATVDPWIWGGGVLGYTFNTKTRPQDEDHDLQEYRDAKSSIWLIKFSIDRSFIAVSTSISMVEK